MAQSPRTDDNNGEVLEGLKLTTHIGQICELFNRDCLEHRDGILNSVPMAALRMLRGQKLRTNPS